MQDLLIFPYNGNGVEALDCLGGDFHFVGFVDDAKEKLGVNSLGHKVFDRTAFDKYPDAKILAVPGSSVSFKNRLDVINSLQINENRFVTIIHPKAVVSENVQIGKNCLIYAGVVITSNAIVGDHVCILPNTVIHHDTRIGEYTLIGSNCCIAGNTTIGRNCYIGSGSSVINNIQIGNRVMIGLGSNVLRSVQDNSKVAGNPARAI